MDPLGSRWTTAPGPADLRWIRVEDTSAAAGCRSAAAGLARRLGFPQPRAEELALAVTEAASNLARHARAGALMLRAVTGAAPAVELVTLDAGPGIADVAAAIQDGTSTAGTLGIGLGTIRRAADFCDVYSAPGQGTILAARFQASRRNPENPHPAVTSPSGIIRAITGEAESGDSYAAYSGDAAVTAMLCDGLGHGPLAATASAAAIEVLREAPEDPPGVLLRRAHERMGRTRGGALAVLQIAGGSVTFAGLGNVAAWVLTLDGRHGMVSVPGIAGHQARRIAVQEYPAPPGSAVILHSDGLSSRWNPRDLPGLAARDPLVIAAALLAGAGVHRDDASILVLRAREPS